MKAASLPLAAFLLSREAMRVTTAWYASRLCTSSRGQSMNSLVDWCRNKAIGTGFFMALLATLYSPRVSVQAICFVYLIGQSGPWIAITGVGAAGTVAWTTRQICCLQCPPSNEPVVSATAAGAALFPTTHCTEREHHLSAYNRRIARQLQAPKGMCNGSEIVRNRLLDQQNTTRRTHKGGHDELDGGCEELVEGLIPKIDA